MQTDFSFTRDRDAAERLQPYLNPLPRSVTRNNAFELLDGEWRFDLDGDDRGMQERWYLHHRFEGTAHWPGTIEALMAEGTEAWSGSPSHVRDEVIAWYERDFEIPPGWPGTNGVVQLTFGACAYETRVWLNGKALETLEGHSVHLGGDTSFSFELTQEHLAPVNRLTVRIANSLDPDRPRGKQESRVYKRGGIWYQTVSGPVRSVWIEPVERNRLRSRLGVVSTIEEGLVEFRITMWIHDPGRYRLRIIVSGCWADEPLTSEEFDLPLEAGEQRQHVVVKVPGARLWSVASPTLYQVVVQLIGPTGDVSQIESRFGLRKFEARGRRVYLNGEPIYLNGILYQPAASTYEEIREHLLAAKQLGCNLMRVHIAGVDPRIFDLADEVGMLIWVEVPSPHRSSSVSRVRHWSELQRLVLHVGLHASVVILSLYNEDWGAQDIARNQETRDYITRAYEYIRLHYPQLLVVDNDGWQHLSIEGRLQSHLLTAHVYETDLERWRATLDRLVAGEMNDVAVSPLVIGDPFFYGGQVPIVVSEWGGFGFPMYGGPHDLEARAEKIRAFKRELLSRPIAGDVYTQATSIEDENNGLLDPVTGRLLVPPNTLSGAASPDGHSG